MIPSQKLSKTAFSMMRSQNEVLGNGVLLFADQSLYPNLAYEAGRGDNCNNVLLVYISANPMEVLNALLAFIRQMHTLKIALMSQMHTLKITVICHAIYVGENTLGPYGDYLIEQLVGRHHVCMYIYSYYFKKR